MIRWNWRWLAGSALFLLVVLVPLVYYRASYATNKRLRTVVPGLVYRSGCLTADGFTRAIQKHQIRTVLNLQEELPDPELPVSYFSSKRVRESELCRQLGVKFRYMQVDLIDPRQVPHNHPAAIDQFLQVMDDPATYPILIHCRAGLHRTGVILALYRMEYQGWTREQALDELRAHGFGEFASTAANDYINQYILQYRPRTTIHQ